ncbi:hypothetical protein [Brachybacterium nesterenkovii]|uniref:hypothetical protein n=1 Tax=Brachybacterium nesterenkovii TaxID=47847 RepID=UPI00321A3A22
MIVGPGRPDQPGTTGGLITGSEPVGCEYRSTDGASVGAWTWRKHATGWVVVDGDTGWRDITSATPAGLINGGGYLKLRRTTTSGVWMDGRFLNGTAEVIVITPPAGFRHSSLDGAKGVLIPTDAPGIAGKMQYRSFGGGFEWKGAGGQDGFGLFTYISDETWPSTLPGSPD